MMAVTVDQKSSFYLLLSLTCDIVLWRNNVEALQGEVEGFNGRRFRVAAEPWEPFVVLSKKPGGWILQDGIMAKILDSLQVSLNFNISLVRPPDGGWGASDDEGRWSGMVGMVKRNEVDFGVG